MILVRIAIIGLIIYERIPNCLGSAFFVNKELPRGKNHPTNQRIHVGIMKQNTDHFYSAMDNLYSDLEDSTVVYDPEMVAQLKVCPICRSLSAADVKTCNTCSWHGVFDTHPASVHRGLDQLMARCPELLVAILPEPAVELSFWARMRSWFVSRRRLDITA
jgi:hypothetical protein